MKRKIFSILFALVLLLSFSLIPAVPAGAVTPPHDRTTAITAAADRLVEMQNLDGGFTWKVDPEATTGPGDSGTNTLGITAMGILKAHELLDKPDYETALAKAYDFADQTEACKYFPDVTFLIGLADACSDASLLAAVDAEVIDTTVTVQSILDLAKDRWDAKLAVMGGGDPVDPVAVANFYFAARSTLAFWDLEGTVKAGLALEPHFPGCRAQAEAIAGVMYANLQSGSTYYFNIENTADPKYALALSGAIEGFSELGVYPTITRTMTDLLIANQYGAGYWDKGGDGNSAKESVQTTAYAVMALIAQGDADAVIAARKGADWFVTIQTETGGWYPGYVGATLENLEVDSEAAWALASVKAPVTIDTKGYYSIQSAIDSASPNDIISVAAGTYNESVTVNESVILLGAKWDVDPREGAWTGDITTINASEGNNGILIAASGVTVNGFKVIESGTHTDYDLISAESGIYVLKDFVTKLTDVVIKYCWCDNNYGSGITVRYADNPLVEYCYLSNNGGEGANVAGIAGQELTGGSISYNECYNNNTYGIYLGCGASWNGYKVGSGENYTGDSGTVVSHNNVHQNSKYGIQIIGYYAPAQNIKVEQNNIHDNGRNGLKIVAAPDNTFSENQFTHNGYDTTTVKYEYGVLLEASGDPSYPCTGNAFTGNSFTDNQLGAIYIWQAGTGGSLADTVAHFNNFTEGSNKRGINNTTTFDVDATLNWWGDASGPYHEVTNPDALGDEVSNNVDFAHWLPQWYPTPPTVVTAAASSLRTTSTTLNATLDDLGSALSVEVSFEWGTTAAYDNTVAVATPLSEAGDFSATISGLSPSTTYHFRVKAVGDGESYGIDRTFTTARRPTGGGGIARRVPPGTTDVGGEISWEGVFEELVTAISEDELCTLTIPEGTVGLTEELEPLDEITMVIMDEPPPPPEDAHVVGLAYDFGPDGATFDPPITLTFSYDPADIPVAEENLVLAYYDEDTGEWVELDCVVDTENNTITASVAHFTTFAIITVPVVAPPAPAAFTVSSLGVSPSELAPSEEVNISVLVANTGGESGSYTVVLKINDVKEAEKKVTVAAGESQDVSFSVAKEEAGSYSVVVDGLSASFTVLAPVLPPTPAPPEEEVVPVPKEVVPPEEEVVPVPAKPINWPVIGGVIGGVIVVGLLIFFLVKRRALIHPSG